jgi:hypothetical protein
MYCSGHIQPGLVHFLADLLPGQFSLFFFLELSSVFGSKLPSFNQADKMLVAVGLLLNG